jgi:hypothetical protein
MSRVAALLAVPLLMLSLTAGPTPALAEHGEEGKPVYEECRREGINSNQCRCFSRYVRLNGEYIDTAVVLRLMQAHPVSKSQTLSEDDGYKAAPGTEGNMMSMAIQLIVDATKECSKVPAF